MALRVVERVLPSWKNALLALLAAGLLILAFPDFEFWWVAWFALAPLMWAVERQKHCVTACFLLGWLFGTAFFFGTCWWLTYAPIHYAAMPWPLAYGLILIACLGAGIFPGIFALILSLLLRRFGSWAFLAAPFVWVFTEFLRYWLTGNNWNAIGYSQAYFFPFRLVANLGGVWIVSFVCSLIAAALILFTVKRKLFALGTNLIAAFSIFSAIALSEFSLPQRDSEPMIMGDVVAIQANVPMSGFDVQKWRYLREKQTHVTEQAIQEAKRLERLYEPTLVVWPESPMNFMYNDDPEFQHFVHDFARRNNVSVLFNSAEPDASNGKYFNSAVMVGPDGKEAAQYDKLYLLPFGEAVPRPLGSIVPAFVGNFSYGSEYDLLTLGDESSNVMRAKVGVMICFESHFGQLSREYVRNGADAIIEMTNDGYLGPTPVLRQHLANAVFRAVETNRPVLRVTNVGITAYIDERGNVHDPLPPYQEGTRVWTVSKSDGSQTFYVRYGDWFAWLCTVETIAPLLLLCFRRKPIES